MSDGTRAERYRSRSRHRNQSHRRRSRHWNRILTRRVANQFGRSPYFEEKNLDLLATLILTFWFGTGYDGTTASIRPDKWSRWFGKSGDTDAIIETVFERYLDDCRLGKFDHWARTPLGTIALLILMDQFARNIYRNTNQGFSFDWKALKIAQTALRKQHDLSLTEAEKVWLYLVLTHAEDLQVQRQCVALANTNLTAMDQIYRNVWINIFEKHLQVIERFGRFPHRNHCFERPSSDEELRFLDDPSCRFDLPATLVEDPKTHERRFIFEQPETSAPQACLARLSRPDTPNLYWPASSLMQ